MSRGVVFSYSLIYIVPQSMVFGAVCLLQGHDWLGDQEPSDPISKALFSPNLTDNLKQQIPKELYMKVLAVLERQSADQLPGGKYFKFVCLWD